MKTTKATALLLCLLLSGCRPVYVIVTQEAPKVNIVDSIQLKINQPWSRHPSIVKSTTWQSKENGK